MRKRIVVRATVLLVAALVLATPAALARPAQAGPRVARDPAVIRTWNAVAVRTIIVEGLKPPPVAQLYLGFVSAAVYNAVVTIDGRFTPYTSQPRPHGHASPEAAAATAAYRVLSVYFPASAEQLTVDYQASLAQIPDGVAKTRGIRVGEDAARTIVRLREGDGRDAAITLDLAPAPGVWRPTPPAFAPMLAPWLGFVRPLLLGSPTQLPLAGPDPLTSIAYTRDFNEVKAMGAAASATRTPAQTETARFWNDSAPVQFQAGFRDLAIRHRLDIDHSARLFAILNMTTADAAIACWRAKYDFPFWRPSTAIQLADTDGNPATTADPTWTPLVINPPYPDYPSGHACLTGATAQGLAHLFGPQKIDLVVSSAVTGTTRHYRTARTLDRDTMNARVWLGIHFRKAMVDGNRLGHRVSRWALRHYFQPLNDD
jgi:PAP2 superfamily